MKNSAKFFGIIMFLVVIGFMGCKEPEVPDIEVAFSGLTANGSATDTTTHITLTFSQEIEGLSPDNITLSGVSGVQKGTLSQSGSGPAYTLQISGFTVGGTLSVSVKKSGYKISDSPNTVGIYYATAITFNNLSANGSADMTTTQLSLTFSHAISGLTVNDITVSGVTGVQKGNLTGSGSTYTLSVSGFTSGGTLIVTVTKPGFNIITQTVTIYYIVPVVLTSVTANGSATETTTQLTLNFDQVISGLTASDITLSGVNGVQKGTLSVSGQVYTLPVNGFTSSGTLSVAVAKSGYSISSPASTVPIFYASNVTFSNVTANGSTAATTTTLTLTFSQAISGLTASDITLSGVSGVTKGTLSGSGPTYTLGITTTLNGTLTVAVAKSGYNISNSPRTVSVFGTPISWTVTGNGSASVTTTALTFTFSPALPAGAALSPDDITFSGVSGVTKGTLSGSGTTYTLGITTTANGTVTVSIANPSLNISPASRTVSIYYLIPVTFSSVTANGSTTAATTTLTLTFNQAITGLTASDITLSGVTGVTKGTLSGSGPTYTLGITTTLNGTLTVAVTKSGYTISPASRTVSVFGTPITFSNVTANGSATTSSTTTLTLTFSPAPASLTAADITLSGVSGVTKGTLSGSGTTYTLGITTTAGGTLTVAISNANLNISPVSKTVDIFYVAADTFNSVTANGSISAVTTQLTLTFDKAIANLSANDITLSGVTGVTKGTLSGTGPTYTLGITTTLSGTLTVAVAKSGFSFSPASRTVFIYGTPVTFSSVTANGSTSAATTTLTLTFSPAPPASLSASDITLSGVTGVTKGTLSGSGTTYTLGITTTASGTLTVAIANSSLNLNPTSRTVTVFGTPITFSNVTADGSSTAITTQLTLTFSASISGLTVSQITLSGVNGATKGTLSGSGTTYTLTVSGQTTNGTLTVAIAKPDSNISPTSRTVSIYGPPTVTFSNLTANGSSTQTSTQLNLTFSQAIVGLAISDFTLSGATGVSLVSLSGTGSTYTIAINVIATASSTLTLSVTKAGYNITPASQTASFYVATVTFNSVSANGSVSVATTQLTLIFSQVITGLSASDITLSGVVGVSVVSLSNTGSTYYLSISVFKGGSLSVAIATKPGYTISGSPKAVTIYGIGWDGITKDTSWYTSNTSATSYTITTADQLAGLAQVVNGGFDFSGRTITLGNDILLNSTADWQNWATSTPATSNSWTPIGTSTNGHQFAGTFNGNGHVISGIYIKKTTTSDNYQGLFGYVASGGTVKNLGIDYSYIKGYDEVGGLAGYCDGKILTSYTTANVTVTGDNYIGGLAGYIRTSITNCYAAGNVTGNFAIEGVGSYDTSGIPVMINCYYNSSTAGAGHGTGLSANLMQSQAFADLLNVGALAASSNKWNYSGGYPTVSTTPITIAYFFPSGSGTASSPYMITTKWQLESLSALVNYGLNLSGMFFKLGSNIQLDNTSGYQNWAANTNTNSWTPIGNNNGNYYYTATFKGSFDGGGYVISGLYINSTSGYQGLFGNLDSGGTIKNLGVVNNGINGGSYTGGLVGYNSSTITNCYAVGSVNGYSEVGGLVGENISTITNCYAAGSVTGSSSDVGGLVGWNGGSSSSITNCYAVGTVTPLTNSYSGGLAGSSSNTITSSYYNSDTSGRYDSNGSSVSKTTTQMLTQSTYTGWDFSTVWAISTSMNNGYPYLRAVTPSGITSTAVTFSNVTADGSISQTTTQLTLSFGQAITGLAANDITLSGVTGVTKGTLSGSGPTYTLPITGITATGTLTVGVSKIGYTISPALRTVSIYYYNASSTILSENFDGATQSFTLVNGSQTNYWYWGTATANSGTKSVYITNNNGTSNAYTDTATSVVHMYHDVTFPTSATPYTLSFNWKAQGEGTSTLYDYLRVFLIETTTSLTAGTQPTGTTLGTYNLGGTVWNLATISIPASYSGTTKRLVFTWVNDSSQSTQPPAAVDNILLTK